MGTSRRHLQIRWDRHHKPRPLSPQIGCLVQFYLLASPESVIYQRGWKKPINTVHLEGFQMQVLLLCMFTFLRNFYSPLIHYLTEQFCKCLHKGTAGKTGEATVRSIARLTAVKWRGGVKGGRTTSSG